MEYVRSKWADLKRQSPTTVRVIDPEGRLSWYLPKPVSSYEFWTRESDARYQIAQDVQTQDVFVGYQSGG